MGQGHGALLEHQTSSKRKNRQRVGHAYSQELKMRTRGLFIQTPKWLSGPMLDSYAKFYNRSYDGDLRVRMKLAK
jgi:hypothetical protein